MAEGPPRGLRSFEERDEKLAFFEREINELDIGGHLEWMMRVRGLFSESFIGFLRPKINVINTYLIEFRTTKDPASQTYRFVEELRDGLYQVYNKEIDDEALEHFERWGITAQIKSFLDFLETLIAFNHSFNRTNFRKPNTLKNKIKKLVNRLKIPQHKPSRDPNFDMGQERTRQLFSEMGMFNDASAQQARLEEEEDDDGDGGGAVGQGLKGIPHNINHGKSFRIK